MPSTTSANESAPAGTPKGGRARGLHRAFAILDHLRETKSPRRPIEIANALGAPRSSVYEIVNTLLEQDILEHSDREGRVFLGRRLHFLGNAYLSHFDLTREAREYLERITFETRETSQLCVLNGNKYTVVLMNEGIRSFRISSDIGELVPIPWTASGRLLTSHLGDKDIKRLIPKKDFTLPDGSRLDPDAFIAESRDAQAEGFFSLTSIVDNFTYCLAAPVYDEHDTCVATLCIISPKEDGYRKRDTYRRILTDAARQLSLKLRGGSA